MSRHTLTVVVDLLPQLGEQIDETVEELEGALHLTASEYGSVVTVSEVVAADDIWDPAPKTLTLTPPDSGAWL